MKNRILTALLAAAMLLPAVRVSADGVMLPIGTVAGDKETGNARLEPDKWTLEDIAADFAYKGEGMCVAVIDTGFFTEHESFILTGEGRLTKEFVDSLELNAGKADDAAEEPEKALPKESFYINEKIPFAYNYAKKSADVSGLASHGTAVVSAIAGNNSANTEHPSGAAPEAQVVLMKVFDDETARASNEAMIAAINDAVTLGVDVICVPFGEACGSSESGGTLSLGEALRAAEDAGIIVVSAAGDSTKLGNVSPYNRYAGLIAPTTDRPDVGTVFYPGSAENAAAIGGSQSNVYTADCFVVTTADGEVKIPYSDTNSLWTLPTGGLSFARFFDGKTLGYEFVPRYGREEDVAGLDLTGKIAVVERGVITFGEKCKNAAARGAIGVIVYDNQPDPDTVLDVRMDISESPIPAVMISGVSADKLRSAVEKSIKVSLDERYIALKRETPTPSSYSAWGGTPELGLGIDFTVAGELIECASSDGGYLTTGGTTIAAARAAGMLACVKEKLVKSGFPAEYAAKQAMNLLSSSARLMTRGDGEVYSPRQQGSGNASLSRALGAEIMVTSEGKNRAEIGEITRNWFTFDVTVTNLTDSEKELEIDALVGSDGYSEFVYKDLDSSDEKKKKLSEALGKQPDDAVSFVEQFNEFKKARVFPGYENMNINAGAENSEPIKYTLGPNVSATFTLTVLLDNDTMAEYERIFTNGYFVEGFVRVRSGEETASLPFMGFKGDWGAGEALDRGIFDGVEAVADYVYLYREYSSEALGGRLILGADPFGGESDDHTLSFSPYVDAKNSAVYLNLGLLKSVSDVKVNVWSGDELIGGREYGYLAKTYVDYASGMVVSPKLVLWDGRAFDNRYYVYPDGDYRVEISYKVAGDDRIRVLRYDLRLDTTAPVIGGWEFEDAGEAKLMTVEVTDDQLLAKCRVYDEYGNEAAFEDGKYDVTALGKYIYIEAFDRAMNSSVKRAANPYYANNID